MGHATCNGRCVNGRIALGYDDGVQGAVGKVNAQVLNAYRLALVTPVNQMVLDAVYVALR